MAALLARVVREQGRDEEALALSRTAERTAAEDDLDAQVLWRSIRAPIVARAGDWAGGEALARAALDLARQTETPVLQSDTLYELSTVLHLASRREEAQATLAEASAIYSAKGDRVSVARASALAARLFRE